HPGGLQVGPHEHQRRQPPTGDATRALKAATVGVIKAEIDGTEKFLFRMKILSFFTKDKAIQQPLFSKGWP
ncbi:MAG: hypothetical protein AABZ60_19785, partial [Planctomycetota bacterium]